MAFFYRLLKHLLANSQNIYFELKQVVANKIKSVFKKLISFVDGTEEHKCGFSDV